MTYNPIFDLVTGAVLILVPVIVLVGTGIGFLISRKQPSGPEPSRLDLDRLHRLKILDSIRKIDHYERRLELEIEDLDERRREILAGLRQETEHLRSLIEGTDGYFPAGRGLQNRGASGQSPSKRGTD